MMIVLRYQDGLLTEVQEAREVDEKQPPVLRAEAEKNRKTLEEADLKRRNELLDKIDQRNKERAREAYYEPSRLLSVINSMLYAYQDGGLDENGRKDALSALGEMRGLKKVEDVLISHPAIKTEYEALYGRID
jgi:acyl-coenzyme A synthetase/AMP-(fatty) acid ligase